MQDYGLWMTDMAMFKDDASARVQLKLLKPTEYAKMVNDALMLEKLTNDDLKLDAIDPDYEDFIRSFKLDERYQQHKRVALHWLEMKYKYSDARIRMMEKSLNHRSFSFTRIKSDIFQEGLYGDGSMNFSKLREDMLK